MQTDNNILVILKALGFDDVSPYVNGTIGKIRVDTKLMMMETKIIFPNVLTPIAAREFKEKWQSFFKNDYKDVKITLEYTSKSMTEELVEKYYEYVLGIFLESKFRYCALTKVNHIFTNKNIVFYVANQTDIETIEPLLKEINKVFTENLGLDLSCIIELSQFETPFSKYTESLKNASNEKIVLSQSSSKETSENKKIVKKPRMKSNLSGSVTELKDIPTSEVELIEYNQKHSSCNFVILGTILSSQIKDISSNKEGTIRKYKIYQAVVQDKSDSTIAISSFINYEKEGELKFYQEEAIKGRIIRAYGTAVYDKYSKDVILKVTDMQIEGEYKENKVLDSSPVKRCELHAHTKMSVMDSVLEVKEYVKRAKDYGFEALGITDHLNIHAWPDFEKECLDAQIKPLYGVEGLLVDEDKFKIAFTDQDIDLKEATFVVYDIETTGLSSNYHEIIEIAACKIQGGLIVDEFSVFVKPKNKITTFITDLTSITNDDVRFANPIEVELPKFKQFFEGSILVAHNATFDNSLIYASLRNLGLYDGLIPTIDTLQLARVKYGDRMKRFNLAAMAKFFDVELTQHHRAIYDARTTAQVFMKMLNDLFADNIFNYNQINSIINAEEAYKLIYPSHVTILSKNLAGKKNLYEIISDSHTKHFSKEPRILKTVLTKHRENLLIGSGCVNGEVFQLAYNKSYEELKKEMQYYDFIEIQPPSLYKVLETDKEANITNNIIDTIKRIIRAAKEEGKIVVATGDVHHLTKEDKEYREIFISAPMIGGGKHELSDLENIPSFHFMTTDEMLKEFSFLDYEQAYEIVVTNSNKIANMIEQYPLFPNELFAPKDDFLADRGIPSVEEATITMTKNRAKEIYGESLHPFINDRIEKELNSIIKNKFAPIYYISYMLVKYSTDAGYVVGSRGSVGSSFVANMMGITEVNSLPPHYVCPECHFTVIKFTKEDKEKYGMDVDQQKFEEVLNSVETGYDLPKAKCPHCGSEMHQDGVDIPFETFLGFKGNKTPDIDLNFSGDFQAQAHEFCRTIFGEDRAFRGGTISKTADKTAYGYVKGYLERKNITKRQTEINQMAQKIVGGKRSTGQHPGGIVVIPKEIEYSDVIPVQYPADDVSSKWRTTHYDYHKFENNLLKLDILGHDDPTMIRHLMDFVHLYPDEFPFSKVEEIPLTDHKVFNLFYGVESLNVSSKDIFNQTIGTTGIPEFGTSLTKNMLEEIRPTTVASLLKISGLSHGTDVWTGNARDLMMGTKKQFPKIDFGQLIGCRDDIMVTLIYWGLEPARAFEIMEFVRKGNPSKKPDIWKKHVDYMRSKNIPDWYIWSCEQIKYMFPKAHATAYVIMALRIGWFKVHRPIFYYAGFFSRRAGAYDVEVMARGQDAIKAKLVELKAKLDAKQFTNKEEELYNTLLLAIEMVARGMRFKQMNIFESEAINFKVLDDRKTLVIPFGALDSLGEATALSIVSERNKASFSSKRDLLKRTKINATQFEKMNSLGVFDGLPEEDDLFHTNLKND